MFGFRISINGSFFLNIATPSDTGVISAVASFAKRPADKLTQDCASATLDCGSIDNISQSEKQINSWPSKPLQLGDKIVIEVVELDDISKPERSEIETTDAIKGRKAAYFEQLKQELQQR
jgi:hypothetical protein